MFLTFRKNTLSYRSKFIKERNILKYARIILHEKKQVQNKVYLIRRPKWNLFLTFRNNIWPYRNQFRVGKEHIHLFE